MTGKGHKATGIGAAFIAGALARWADLPELVACAMAAGSCTLPDWLEVPLYKKGMRTGSLIPHRTITHWPPIWLAVIWWATTQAQPIYGSVALGVAIGALTHILGDAPNPMGIPWVVPFKRNRIGAKGLWRSGEWELLIVLGYTALGLGLWRIATGWRPGDVFWAEVSQWLPRGLI